MQRRNFLWSGLGASAALLSTPSLSKVAEAQASGALEFYQVRRYKLQSGPQTGMTNRYFTDALIPALNRLGIGPVGAFSVYLGPETPTYYLVMPSTKLETLVTAELALADDAEFVKAAASYWNTPAASPAFTRIESSLHVALSSYPKITPPKKAEVRAKQVYQLRVYESATWQDHVTKIDMIKHGEDAIFKAAGFDSVFYSDTLIGAREPSLMYMVSVPTLAHLEPAWNAFLTHPDWKKLAADHKYAFEPTVSDITSLVLYPLPCSQI